MGVHESTIKVPYGIPYGVREIEVELPSNMKLIKFAKIEDTPKVEDEKKTIMAALKNPIGSKSLYERAKKARSVVILSDDKSRPTPSHVIIPILLDELNAMGIKDEAITVVIGRGLHPEMKGPILEKKFGKKVLDRVTVINHDPDSNLAYLGKTTTGTPVYINKTVMEADLKIGLGTIIPHELAGYTGGAGIIIPGVAGRKTIDKNHMLVGRFEAKFGKIKGNLIRRDMEEAAKMAKLDLIINTLLNCANEIVAVFSGEPVKAHREGVKLSRKLFGVAIPRLADLVIASSHPRDETFGKSLKAVFSSDLATKPNGSIILIAPSYNGISYSEEFKQTLLKGLSTKTLFKMINQGELPGESCVLYLFSLIKQRKKIIVVSKHLSEENLHKIGLEFARTIDEALEKIKGKKEVTVIPLGSVTLPILKH